MTRAPFSTLIKQDEETNPAWGTIPAKRSVQQLLSCAFINLDKPAGPTSHQASEYVKRILKVSKAGHSGTLDPKVTGVLPVALDTATKLNALLLSSGKEYIGVMHLHRDISDALLDAAKSRFLGKIRQLPPIKSAVKRQMRTREIYALEFLEREGNDVLFRADVQAGTYIRKLVHDIGEYLSCGAHMGDLRRTRAAGFREDTLVSLHDLREAYTLYTDEDDDRMLKSFLTPAEIAVAHVPRIFVSDYAVGSLTYGAYLAAPGVCMLDSDIRKGETVLLVTLKGELIGFGIAKMDSQEMMESKRGYVASTDAILMPRDTYPKAHSSRV